jgi:DNA-binding NtrC family response regulator
MRLKILVVEDDDSFRTVLNISLQRVGHEVMLAENEVKAFQLNQDNDFDIVISDVEIDQADGLNLINKIKDINPDTITIIISSYLPFEQHLENKRIRPHYFLYKPFQFQQLIKILREIEAEKNGKNTI